MKVKTERFVNNKGIQMTDLNITDGHVVEIAYLLTNTKGEKIDESSPDAPLAYIQGKQNIIPGLENQMAGKTIGDKFTATVDPKEGYGERIEEMTQAVPKTQFKDTDNLQVGMQFQVQDPNGQQLIATVAEIQDEHIILDGNHPLAGMTLNFDVEVVSIREATEEEMTHGHLHAGAGCCGGDEGCGC